MTFRLWRCFFFDDFPNQSFSFFLYPAPTGALQVAIPHNRPFSHFYSLCYKLCTVQCIVYHDHHDHHYDYHDHHYDYHMFDQRLKEHMHETTVSQFNIAENVADLYKEKQVLAMMMVMIMMGKIMMMMKMMK